MSAATVTAANNAEDAKLRHLVRKLMETTTTTGSSTEKKNTKNTCDAIVALLRTQHREYQRKDAVSLRLSVQAAIQQIYSTGVAEQQQQRSSSSNKKRRQQEDDEEYERAAAIHEAVVGGGGLLNVGLRNSYHRRRQQQQQQHVINHQAEEDASVVISSEASSSTSTNTMTVVQTNNVQAEKQQLQADTPKRTSTTSRQEGDIASSTAPNNGAPCGNSNNKRKKLKRSNTTGISRRSSGSKFNDDSRSSREIMSSSSFLVPERPTERYADLGGLSETIQSIRQLVEYPLTRPELYRHLGVDPPRGVLLRGPPGTGKTHLANAVAGQLGVPYFRVSAPELVSGMSGESEGRIRDLFQAASDAAPSIIFVDEIDAVAPKRNDNGGGGNRGMEKRMVAQLLTSMDHIAPHNNRHGNAVLVLAATNRPDSLDAALRRAGRFDKEILLGVPDESAREMIIRTMTAGMRLLGSGGGDGDDQQQFDYKLLARKTPGFVGADVKSLAKEAAVIAINRIFRDVLKDESTHHDPFPEQQDETKTTTTRDEPGVVATLKPLTEKQMEPLYVTMEDFLAALPLVQPSSQREGFATVPDVTWDDIGALQSIREELTISVLEPIRAPEKFQALGLSLPAGVMLYGPPGCGKTLLAKAVAHESGANFISVKGPELLDKYVGESERAVRLVFERARSSSPCIVFFDELDSLVPRRGSDSGAGGGGVSERVVNQLLTEMDGLESRRSVFVIAATNRPELIDPAMMRPGRLDKLLYVPLPTAEERVSILQALATNVKLTDDVDLGKIGRSARAEGYSGADCAALLREAGLAVMKEDAAAVASGKPAGSVSLCVKAKHFDAAFSSVMPSVSKRDQARYDRIRDRMARARSRGVPDATTDTEDDSMPVPSKDDKEICDAVAGSSREGDVIPVEPEKKKKT